MDLAMPPIKINMPVIKHLVCQLILNHSIYFFVYGILYIKP
jgi:hypothetical protein